MNMTKTHHDLCPVHQAPERAAWCCCIALETAEQDALDRARAAVESVGGRMWIGKADALNAIDELRALHG